MRIIHLLMLPMLVCAIPVLTTAAGMMMAEKPVMQNQSLDTDDAWVVQVFSHTIFFPEAGPPGQYHIDDLLPGMRVAVIGTYVLGENRIHADMINFARDPHGGYDSGSNHGGGGCPFIGFVTMVSPEDDIFEITRFQHQEHSGEVLVTDEVLVIDAPPGGGLTVISYGDLHPGDPVMVHGQLQDDLSFLAEIIVRSDDWDMHDRALNGATFEYFGVLMDFFGPHPPYFLPGFMMFKAYETGDEAFTSVVKTVGPMGDLFRFPWGHLDFPPNALDEPVQISVSSQFMFWNTLENVYFFQPHGLEFNVPVEIEIRYFNLDGIDPDLVSLSYYDEELGRWVIATHMTHYPEEHAFRGMIEHFSRYSLSTNNRPIQQLGQASK